jgi:ABC-type amino acid transport system permease subunit
MVFHRPPRSDTWVSSSAAPIVDSTGALLGAVATYTDITELHSLQEQRDDVIRAVSHDLRVPLAVVLGQSQLADMMLARGSADQARRSLAAITTSARRINLMIQDLVDSVRIGASQLRLNVETLDFGAFIPDLWARLVGTLEMVGIATVLSIPLAIATAIFLSEIGGRLARPVRMIVDAMSAIPSIVAGLFILAAFILTLHQQQSGTAAALALAVLMLPTVTRTAEVVLRLTPGGLREASFSLRQLGSERR